MKVTDTKFPDVKLIEPTVFRDERGFLFESFNHKRFEEVIGRKVTFVQDNHSKSRKGVLRGLHYQLSPHAQGKLVRVIQGEIFDVVVDIRKSSPNFGQWLGYTLSAQNKQQIWIPEGFAHGFLTMSESSEVIYKMTDYYFPENQRTLKWNSKKLDIKLASEVILISENDEKGEEF